MWKILMYIGKRIKEDVLINQRAKYGKLVVKNLPQRLIGQYGSGCREKKLRHCIRSAETFSEEEIMYAMRTQLNWIHLREVASRQDNTTNACIIGRK